MSAVPSLHCGDCGYGIARSEPPERCPMCGGQQWLTSPPRSPLPASLRDEDYWLSHCEGFQVRTPERRLGVVREVRFRTRLDRPDELVVCGGLFANREQIIAVSEVTQVVPREEQVHLRSDPQPIQHRRLRIRPSGV